VGELLTLSRLEAGMGGAVDEEVDLVELIAGIADDARFEAETNGRQVRFCGDGEFVVKARAELLHRALDNVIRNAVKYTREGTEVGVEIERRTAPDRLMVTVADRGPGVPESDLQTVLEPFFRSGSSAATAGFGLGLAIARRAIEMHGGTIHARRRDDPRHESRGGRAMRRDGFAGECLRASVARSFRRATTAIQDFTGEDDT